MDEFTVTLFEAIERRLRGLTIASHKINYSEVTLVFAISEPKVTFWVPETIAFVVVAVLVPGWLEFVRLGKWCIEMKSKTVREAVRWQSDQGISYLSYHVEHLFLEMLTDLFPEELVRPTFTTGHGVDLALRRGGETFLIQIKVTAKPELLPPTRLLEVVAVAEQHRLGSPDTPAHFVLITNYYLPDEMTRKLTERGITVFPFELQEHLDSLRTRLRILFVHTK